MQTELQKLCASEGVTIKCAYGVKNPDPDMSHCMDPWTVTLRYQGRRLTTNFYMGSGHAGKEPTAADVVSSLILDASAGEQSFEDFCTDLGYDTDSRRAFRTYTACRKTAPKIHRLLGDAFDRFAAAEH